MDLIIAQNPTLSAQFTRAQLVEAGNLLVIQSMGQVQPVVPQVPPPTQLPNSTPLAVTAADIAFLKPLMADFVKISMDSKTDGFSAPMIQALQYDSVNRLLQNNPQLATQYSQAQLMNAGQTLVDLQTGVPAQPVPIVPPPVPSIPSSNIRVV